MSLPETVIALAIITILLTAFVAVSESLVSDSADRHTAAVLRTLGKALETYREAHGVWPSGLEPRDIDTPMARCLAALRSSPATADMVADLPGQRTTSRGYLTLVDGFGRPMIYINPAEAAHDAHMARWASRFHTAADQRPFILSAGRDGDFGDLSASGPARDAADNLDSL